jgi:hypothetical protein
MPEEFESRSDEELRRAIRAEIEQRDRERTRQSQERAQDRNSGLSAERRRQIYQEEMRRYYAQRPGYREIVREDGESDWVPESEIQKSEALFEEALADPLDVRKRLRLSLAAGAAAVAILAAIFFFVLAAKTGSISVSANVPDAQIILDTVPLQHFTNTTIEEVPEGEHVVTVRKEGYAIVGEPVQRITVRGGKTLAMAFTLRPALLEQTRIPAEIKPHNGSQRP